MIHLYCGDGKGKTTAALGLALRAVGHGIPVLVVRFLKNDASGEVEPLKNLPGVQVVPCNKTFGFSWEMTCEQKQEAGAYYTDLFCQGWDLACGRGGVALFDELAGAVDLGFVSQELVLEKLASSPEGLEVVITGREPSPEFLELADYVTQMQCLKHPYERGVKARPGVEY